MRNRRLILGVALILTAVLAYVLQDVARTTIILPAAYISWVAGIYYRSIPQFLTWVLALMTIFFVLLFSLIAPKAHRVRHLAQPVHFSMSTAA